MLSVIITTYNRKEKIRKAIDSVLNQTYKEYELIIVDDGSQDNTEEVVRKYKEKGNKIKYYFKKNGGAASAKNYGVKKSKYPYIMFLDSDDSFYDENVLLNIFHELFKSKSDFIAFSKIIKVYTLEKKEQIKKNQNLLEHVLKSPLNYPGLPLYVFKKDLYLKSGGMDEELRWGEALGFWRRYFRYAQKNQIIDNYSYKYYLDTNNSVSKGNNRKDNIVERIKTIEKAYEENKEYLSSDFKAIWLIILFYFAFRILEKEKMKKYIMELKKTSFKEVLFAIKYIYDTKLKK